VYVVLETNDRNVKRTARDTGVPENTVRRWRDEWKTNGPPSLDEVTEAAFEYATAVESTRDLALQKIHERIAKGEGTLAQLATVFGVLTDKIDRARGIADRRVEHVHSLPSPDEIRATLGALVQSAQAGHAVREEEIVDAEFIEQPAPALPAGTR